MAIAGGVVRNHGGLDEDLVAIIRADQLRGEADGVTVEERIIEASLRSLGAERAAVERIFLFLATLPEDASVPKAALDALAPTLVVASAQPSSSAEPGRSGGGAGSLPTSAIDLARMRHQLHTRLNRLVQLSLVRGSAHEGNLMLHDLVRELGAAGVLPKVVTVENWAGGVARHVVTNQSRLAVFSLGFVLVTRFVLMNMVAGVIVDQTLRAVANNAQDSEKQ